MATWTQRGSTLTGPTAYSYYGTSASVSSDGTVVAIGASAYNSSRGAVYVYSWNGTSWTQRAFLSGDSFFNDPMGFGQSVSLSSNGSILAVGGPSWTRVFVFSWNGSSYVQYSSRPASTGTGFGTQIKLSSDGSTIAISAPSARNAVVYKWDGSAWNIRGSIFSGVTRVDLSSNGLVVACSDFEFNNNTGIVKVYSWNGTSWIQRGSNIQNSVMYSSFGYTIALSQDGSNIVISAIGTNTQTGTVYVYDWNGSSWNGRTAIDGAATSDMFGTSLDISPDGKLIAIGSIYNDTVASNAGQVKVYSWNGSAWSQRGSSINGVVANEYFSSALAMSSDTSTIVIGGTGGGSGATANFGISRIYTYPPPATPTAAITEGRIDAYVSAQTTTTDTQKTTLAVDMRTAIKNASYANNTAKAADQLSYINSMRTKIGASSYTVPTANFASFTATLATSVSGLATQPIVSFFPTFSGTSATLNVASVTNTSYLHVEVPVGYSVTLQNGIDTKTLTYNGTSYTDGTNTYTTNTSIVLGEKRYTIVGIGSLFFSLSNRNVECMVQGTQILTPAGYVPIESLHDGDLVITGAKQVVPVSNMHKIVVVRATEKNAPYVIEKDAFGTNCPPNRLEVSPRHAIQLEPGLWEMPREAAKENKRVYQNKDALGKEVVYYHFSLFNYETDSIVANGQITECLNDGKTVVESYAWDKERRGYRRVTKPIEQKNTLRA